MCRVPPYVFFILILLCFVAGFCVQYYTHDIFLELAIYLVGPLTTIGLMVCYLCHHSSNGPTNDEHSHTVQDTRPRQFSVSPEIIVHNTQDIAHDTTRMGWCPRTG